MPFSLAMKFILSLNAHFNSITISTNCCVYSFYHRKKLLSFHLLISSFQENRVIYTYIYEYILVNDSNLTLSRQI